MNLPTSRLLTIASICLLAPLASPAAAQRPRAGQPATPHCIFFRTPTAPDAAALQSAIENFRNEIGGVDNGVGGGRHLTGRREVNWDDTLDGLAEPNDSSTSWSSFSRGLVLHSSTLHGRFLISADSSTDTNTAVRFGNIEPSYMTAFQTFSGERLLAAADTTVVEVEFRIPNTAKRATVRSFGVVFADVDSRTPLGSDSNVSMRFYTYDGFLLGGVSAQPANDGLSFVGVHTQCSQEIARVEIFVGTAGLAEGNVERGQPATPDVVAMDDFIFSEPRAIGDGATDFDGDGLADVATFRPSDGVWRVKRSSLETIGVTTWGAPDDIPVAADYDGDLLTDIAVFRPSDATWWIRYNNLFFHTFQFGQPGDVPVPADYDHDGKTDLAVWRPSDGRFYISFSSNPAAGVVIPLGTQGDIPIPK